MHVAYFVNQYPKVSHTFIRREILALEAAGVRVTRFALRCDRSELVDPEDIAEWGKTRLLLKSGPVAMLAACAGALLRRPAAFVAASRLCLRLAMRAQSGKVRHLIYFAEACLLSAWIRRTDISHLHAHFGTNSAAVAMLAHELGSVPYSFTIHGPEEFDMPVALSLDEKIRRARFVVAISSYCRSQIFRWSSVADWSKVHVVRCGLDASMFSDGEAIVPANRRLLCIGRLSPEKGQLLLIRAVHVLATQGIEVELVLAGDGPLRTEIEATVRELQLGRQVRITGWIDSRSIREELRQARALVLASFAEGLPVVIMEALAACRPVISTFVAGIPELIEDQVNGWLIPAGDIDSLVNAMRRAIETDPSELARMGAAGRQRALQLHSAPTEAAKLARLF